MCLFFKFSELSDRVTIVKNCFLRHDGWFLSLARGKTTKNNLFLPYCKLCCRQRKEAKYLTKSKSIYFHLVARYVVVSEKKRNVWEKQNFLIFVMSRGVLPPEKNWQKALKFFVFPQGVLSWAKKKRHIWQNTSFLIFVLSRVVCCLRKKKRNIWRKANQLIFVLSWGLLSSAKGREILNSKPIYLVLTCRGARCHQRKEMFDKNQIY